MAAGAAPLQPAQLTVALHVAFVRRGVYLYGLMADRAHALAVAAPSAHAARELLRCLPFLCGFHSIDLRQLGWLGYRLHCGAALLHCPQTAQSLGRHPCRRRHWH